MAPANTVAIPPKSDPRWAALVTNGTTRPLKSLVLKLRLTRLNLDVKADRSPATLAKNINELYQFFTENTAKVKDDAASLFG